MGLFTRSSKEDTPPNTTPRSRSRLSIRSVFTPSRRQSFEEKQARKSAATLTKSKSLTVLVEPRTATANATPCRFVATSTKLGSGAYGAVLLGHDLAASAPVAIKFIPDGRMRTSSLEREVSMLQRLSDAQHPALVKFLGHIQPHDAKAGEVRAEGVLPLPKHFTTCHALVMECVRGGELFDYVVKCEGLKEPEAAPLMAQLCDAVHQAHTLGIAHRDLKLENVLLVRKRNAAPPANAPSGESSIKLIDWGLAHQHALDEQGHPIAELLHSRCGSRSYMAPEVTNRDISGTLGYDGFAADVWSLGVCLFAMHLAFFPFEQAHPEHDWRARRVIDAQRKGLSTMATILSFYPQKQPMGGLSEPLIALLDRMLIFNPKKRATLPEVLCSEFLAPFVPASCYHLTLARTVGIAQRPHLTNTRSSSSVNSESVNSDGASTPRGVMDDALPPLFAPQHGRGASLASGSYASHRRSGSDGTSAISDTASSIASSMASSGNRGSSGPAQHVRTGSSGQSLGSMPFPHVNVAAAVATAAASRESAIRATAQLPPPPPSPLPEHVVAGHSPYVKRAALSAKQRRYLADRAAGEGQAAGGEGEANAMEIATMFSKACKVSKPGSPRHPDRQLIL